MKKIRLIAAVLTALMAFTACGNTNKPETPDAPADTSAAVQTEAAPQSEPAAQTEAQTQAAAKQTEIITEGNTEIFKGACYEITVDTTKWMNGWEYIEEISKMGAENNSMGLTAEQLESMCDVMYMYNDNLGANFNFTSMELGDMEITPEIYGPLLEQQYASVEEIELLGWDTIEINGCRGIRAEVKHSADASMKMLQYMFWEKGYQVICTLTTLDTDFDTSYADFEKMINTLKFN